MWPIAIRADIQINQSDVMSSTMWTGRLLAREKCSRTSDNFFFGFNFHWLRQRSARSFSKSQSEQNKTITFETHLKIAAEIENTFLRSIILIVLKKEALGLSANHKQRKIRLLVSKLIANRCKLKTHLREKCCEKTNRNCLF